MKRHAKASPVGSNPGLGNSLGSSLAKLLASLCLALALVAALTASPALALETHPYTGTSFGPDGTTSSSFVKVGSVGVDPAGNNVYVYDWGAGKIYKFDAAGNPVNFSGLTGNVIEGAGSSCCTPSETQLAVAPPGSPGGTAGDIYLANGSAVLIYAPSGQQLGEINPGGETCGVAVNPSGHVFVGTYPSSIREYTPSANPATNADQSGAATAELPETCNVGADGLGNVYAANFEGTSVVKLEGLDAASKTQLEAPGPTLAVDPATDDVYVNRGSSVAQYDPFGSSPANVFGSARLSESIGIAVNGTSGDVYVGNGKSQRVEVFGPLGIVPDVSAEAASAITPHTATLNGIVNPDGVAVTGCEFEYATDSEFKSTGEYSATAPCEGAIPPDSSDHPVTAALSGLDLETTYHFRLVASNANGANPSADGTFATAGAAFTGEATAIAGTKATLNGVVFPEGEVVSECFFEYGTTSSLGKTAPCEGAIPPDEGEHAVSAALTHLAPNRKTYFFRLVINRGGVIEGALHSFKTTDTVITGAASAIDPPTATVEGTVNPEGIPYTECSFELGTTIAEPQSNPHIENPTIIPCTESPAAIGEGTNPVAVHANLSGLVFEDTYHYQLTATNVDGTAKGGLRSFNTPGVPLIENEQATGVTDTEAELIARINPKGLATTNHFEYGTTTSYGQSTADAEVGADETGHTVSTLLEGLSPDTVYHWRAVAINSHGEVKGPDRSFTTHRTFSPETNCPNQALRSGASANLPDCRAYEMVSPPKKVGEVHAPGGLGSSCGECLPGLNDFSSPMQSTDDGEAIVYQGQPFAEGLSSGPNEYLSRRAVGGWGTQSLSTPLFQTSSRQGYQGFSADLARGVLFQIDPPLSPEAPTKEGKGFANLYLRTGDGSLQPVITEAPPHKGPGSSGEYFDVLYAGANSGAVSAPAFAHLIFSANDALTDATAFAPEAPEIPVGEQCGDKGDSCNLYEWADGQLRLVNVLPGNAAAAPKATLGSGFLLTASPQNGGSNVDHAISADGSRIFWSDEATGQSYVRIDGEETRKIEDPGTFVTTSEDGAKALLSDGCLYEVDAETCEDLTSGQGGFKGTLGASEDLSRVYFVATAALTPPGEENANHEHAEAGKFNLYAWHAGAIAFIGILVGADDEYSPEAGAWRAPAGHRTAQVSPDGRYLAFMSRAPLTGYDNEPANFGACGVSSGQSLLCREVFEYDIASATLACASCNPANQQPLGTSNLSLIATSPNYSSPLPQPGNLTAAGEGRLFFESQDVLSPRDTNGTIQDVYEWTPNGVGGCKRAAGCVSLISSGNSPNDSMFVDSTPSGNDAFIVTREQLLPRDKDELLDLYDARVGGGFAENPAPPCLGEACKGPSTTAPEQQSAGSSTFSGPGNEKPKKAKKHKKKRRKHAHKHKSQKRSAKHNSGGSK